MASYERVENGSEPPRNHTDGLRLTWVGHSTVRIDLDGVSLLTDPLLRRRVMHLQRVVSVESELYEDIDAVLISHAHYDHLDVPSLRKIGRSVRVIVARGGRGFLRRRAFPDVVQLAEGDETIVGDVRVRAVFAEHSNMRASTIALSPALGYVISGSQRVYFAGGTDLFPGMEGLASDLDVALLPIGGWGQSLRPGHLGPRKAAEAVSILCPRVAIPIHWGTYAPLFPVRATPSIDRDPTGDFLQHASQLAPDIDVRVLEVGGMTAVAAARPAGADARPEPSADATSPS